MPGRALSPSVATRLLTRVRATPDTVLTPREIDVVAQVAHAEVVEGGRHAVDEREVRFRTLGVEGDETLQDVEGLEALGHAA